MMKAKMQLNKRSLPGYTRLYVRFRLSGVAGKL